MEGLAVLRRAGQDVVTLDEDRHRPPASQLSVSKCTW